MKRSILSGIVTVMVLLFTSQACQKADNQAVEPAQYQLNYVPAKTSSELVALSGNPEVNIIRNIGQLDYVLNNKLSPLSKLSEKDLSFFKQNLIPGKNGFGSIHVGVLKNNLSVGDYEKVMAMFGLDTKDGFWRNANSSNIQNSKTGASRTGAPGDSGDGPVTNVLDHQYYKCDGKHNCERVTQDIICTSNC